MKVSALLLCFLPALATATATGCALTSKSAPIDIRYFTLDDGAPVAAAPATAPGTAAGKKLRLGTVTAAAHLHERMVYRDSPVELGYHERARWSERPDAYVRRALSRALFQERGVEQVLSGGGHVIDVDLLALDEFTGDSPKARLTVAFSLHDDERVLLESTVSVEKPIAKQDDAPAAVEAFREALREAIAKVADQTVAKLEVTPNPAEGAASASGGSALQDGAASSNANDTCANLKGAELLRCKKKRIDPSTSPKGH